MAKTHFLNCDVLEGLRQLPDESVDCIVTSPPYWGLRDYGTPAVIYGGKKRCKHEWSEVSAKASSGNPAKYDDGTIGENRKQSATCQVKVSEYCRKCKAWRGQLGLEPTIAEFISHMQLIFAECYRVLKPSGTLWVNMGDSYYSGAGAARLPGGGTQGKEFKGPKTQPNRVPGSCGNLRRKSLIGQPWRLAFALQDEGWILRRDIIWQKPSPMPESAQDRCTTAHEYIFHFSKAEQYYYNRLAISEPVVDATMERLSQPTYDTQAGSDRANGGTRPSRPMKALKPIAGWDSGPGDHCVVAHAQKLDLGGPNSKFRTARVPGCSQPMDEDARLERVRGSASARMGRDQDWRSEEQPATRNARSVWTIASAPYAKAHFATFPPELPRKCILAGCPEGGTVLDIFAGSGTTLAVAVQLGRKAIGIELNPEYCDLIRDRMSTVTGSLFVEGGLE